MTIMNRNILTLTVVIATGLSGCASVSPVEISATQQYRLASETPASTPAFRVIDKRTADAKVEKKIEGGIYLGDQRIIPSPAEAVQQALHEYIIGDKSMKQRAAFLDGQSLELTKFEITFNERDLLADAQTQVLPGMILMDGLMRSIAQSTLGAATVRVRLSLNYKGIPVIGHGIAETTSSPGSLFTRNAFERAIALVAQAIYLEEQNLAAAQK
jgi:hypothetical protein